MGKSNDSAHLLKHFSITEKGVSIFSENSAMSCSAMKSMFTVLLSGSDIFVLGMCWLCPIILRWITGTAWRLVRKYWLFISLELLALNLVLVTILTSHVILNSPLPTVRLLKCTVLNLTSGYQDNWPLFLIFHKKIKISFSKKLIPPHQQAMSNTICMPLAEFRVDLICSW